MLMPEIGHRVHVWRVLGSFYKTLSMLLLKTRGKLFFGM
jgi:hypothetical protein